MNDFILPLILASFAFIAFLYSSVGYGGASGYLALMSICAFSPNFMKPAALALNILAASISSYFYYRKGAFQWKLFYPFALTSIPFSFLGGIARIDIYYYKLILAFILLFSALRLLLKKSANKDSLKPLHLPSALLIGAMIGYASGLLGIGGGILLSPAVLFLSWGSIKQTAAISGPFVLLNSISGFIGFMIREGELNISLLAPICGAVLIGSAAGSYYGSSKLNGVVLKYFLVIVLCVAVLKIFVSLR